MKRIMIGAIACFTSLFVNAMEIVKPDIELGYWITVADTSVLLEQALASVPEASRPMMRKMMEDQMGDNISEECITQATLDNFDKIIEGMFGEAQNCTLSIIETTKSKLVASMVCPGTQAELETLFTNKKIIESTLISQIQGMPSTTIKIKSEWKSEVCPQGIPTL